MNPINLFYKEPDPDRWLPFDRYPRAFVRNTFRPRKWISGQKTVALNLMNGLDNIGVPYRFNDFSYIRKHPEEIACVIGKPFLLEERKWKNPILFGAAVFSHPVEFPNLFERFPQVRKILVPGEWMRQMLEPFYQKRVSAWPVGIDTNEWGPHLKGSREVDFLIYDKIRWQYDRYKTELLQPILESLHKNGYTFETVRYMHYTPGELKEKISRTRACIFLCEHETQGLAYQQILATGTPILAWDRMGYWQDPSFYPDKVQFKHVSSVPYWDDSRCGARFANAGEFESKLKEFTRKLDQNSYNPRQYILDNLTLEKCAARYVAYVDEIKRSLK